MSVVNVNMENYSSEVENSVKTVVLDFWAVWCGPCGMMSPIVDEFAEENQNIKVGKVNVDDAGDLAAKFRIVSIPTLVVLKDGKEVRRSVGVISKSELAELVSGVQ